MTIKEMADAEFPDVTWENSPVEITSLKKNSLYEDCLSKVNPETRAEVRKNMEKMLNKEKLNAVRNRMMIVCRIYDELDEKNLDIDQFLKMMQWDNETAMKYLSCDVDFEDSVLDQINDCLGINVKDYDKYNIV